MRGGTTLLHPGSATAWVLALVAVAVWALVAVRVMPRGPTSTAESLCCLAVGLLLGLAAGFLTGSRWAALAAPAAFVVVFELARLPVDGPTVDGIHLTTYGAMAFVTGRLFHGLVALLPMAWAAFPGAALARRRPGTGAPPEGSTWGRRARVAGVGVGALAVAALTLAVARPATTDPLGVDGRPLTVAELTRVEVGGHELGLMLRGEDATNPVLLFLAGGPGGSELGAMRRHLPELERHFTVATWDQRGTGRSYGELDHTSTVTLDAAVQDTIAVTDHLRERFGQEQVYLVGQSWGSTLGVLALQRAPERYAAFVGVGQMVSQRATDEVFYRDTLEWAEATGREGLAADLRDIGPPPYDDPLHYETVLSHEMDLYPYDHSANSEGAGQMSENLLVPEYSLTEQVRLLSGTVDTFAVLYPQLQGIDFRETATALEVPVFFVQGAHEAPGRADLFDEWYPMVEAPTKDVVVLDSSGHRPMFEQPGEFVAYLTDVVLPATTGQPSS